MSRQIDLTFDGEPQRPPVSDPGPPPAPHYDINGRPVEHNSLPELLASPASQRVTRPIHYLGSKLRLVDLICQAVDGVDPTGGPVCDLFAGSGTVSRALSVGRNVVAVDIQEYSRVLCCALLQPADLDVHTVEWFWRGVRSSPHREGLSWAIEPLANYEASCLDTAAGGDLEPLCDLLEHGSLMMFEQNVCGSAYPSLRSALGETLARLRKVGLTNAAGSLVTRYFGGIYFSFSQATQLDALLEAVASLPLRQREGFLAAVLSTASEVVNTVGKQFAQPLRPRAPDGKPKANLLQLVTRDRYADVMDLYEKWLNRYLVIPKTGRRHQTMREDYATALESLAGQVSVIYADPPYTRDHYSRFYHVLETMCLRDNPSVSTVCIKGEERVSRGMYRLERHQSPFCIKSKAPGAFSTLFSKARSLGVPLVLSYSPYEKNSGARPRLMTVGEIEELARKYFGRVKILRAGRITHNKLNSSEKNVGVSYDAEVLMTCEP